MQPEVSTIEDAPKVEEKPQDNLKSDMFKPQSTETPSLLDMGAQPKDYFAEAGAKAMEDIRQERQAREYQEIMKPLSGFEGREQKKVLEERKKQIEAQLSQSDAVRNAAARTNMAKALENVDKELQVLNEQQKQWQEQYGSWTPSSARRFREQTMEQTWYDPYAVVPEEYKALATQKWGKEGSEDAYFSAWMNLSPKEREAFVKREHIKSFFNEETANRMQGIRERALEEKGRGIAKSAMSPMGYNNSAEAAMDRMVQDASNVGTQTIKALDKAEEIKQAYKNHQLDENFFAGAYKGMKDGLTDIDNWTGLYMVGEMTNLYDIADKMEKGEALSQTEEDFLDAQAYKLAVEAALADDLGWGYSSGNVTGASVPFMLQMLASPIGGASGKAIDKGFAAVGRRAIDKFGKGILKKLLTKAPVKKVVKGLVGTVGKGIGQTILFGSDRVAAGTMERHLGNEMVAERANEEFNAGVQAKAGEDLGTALFKAGVSTSMENISEFAGGAFIDDFTKMVGKKISKEFMDAMGGSVGRRMAKAAARQNANKVFRAIANNKWGQHAVNLSKSVQSGMEWDGLLNEYLEEVLNNASNVMIGDMSMEDFTSLEKNAETLLGLAWTSGFFMANNAASRVGGYARGNIALKRTDRAARQIFTGDMQEKWDAYTQALSQADGYEEVEQLYKGLMTDISKNQDKEAAKAQMSEATAYMANYVKMMGMNAATEEADEEEQKTPAQKEVETAQGEGIAAQGTEEELDVVEEMDESYNQLAGHLEGTNVEDWLLQYGETADKQLEAIRGSELDEQTKAMAEAYLTSAQRYEGLLLANQEEVDAIVDEAAKEFDANVNQELGSVIQVLTTQGKTAYVIQGNPNERENIRLRYEDGTTEPVSHVAIEKVLSQADAQTMRSDMIEGVRKSAVAEVVKRMQGVVPNATQMQMPVGHNVVVDGQAGVVAGVNADGTMQIQMQGGNVVNAAPQQVMDAQTYNTIMERKARARESARVSVPVREEVVAPVAEEATAKEAVAEEEELTEAQKLLQEYMDESISLEDRQAIVGNNVAQAKQAAMEAQAEVDAMTESKPKATDYTSIAEFKQAQEEWKAQMQEKQQALDLARQQEATWSEVQKGMVQPVETATEQTSAEAVPATPQVTEVQRAEAKNHNSKHDIKALAKEIGVSAKRIQRVIDFANQVGVKLNFASVTRTQGGKGAFTNADNIAKERTITLSKYQLAKGMAIEWVMGHELTHQIKADGNAANWEAYKQAIINALGQDAFDKRVKEQSKVYREAGAYQDMSANEFVETMQEEVCADAAGDMLLNPDNMNKVMGVPQSLASRIWSALKGMVTFSTPSKIKQAVDAWQQLAEGKELTGEADGRERHSIVGTTGARALDKAEGSTVRMDNMDVAEEMEAAGKDAETIWMATGWERGADGKWRYDANDYIPEFVDNTAKKQVYEDLIDAKTKEYEAATNPAERHELRMKIGEYMDKSAELSQYFVADILGEDHPLIKAYPDLGNITIEFNPNTENCAYYPQIDLIELGTKNEDAKQNARNLAHELQHAIQHTEGFATGASTSNLNERLKKKFEAITAQIEQLRAEGRNEEADALIKQNKGLAEAVINNEGDVFGNYMKVAGEVEARNASARQDMTPEERRQTSPSKSEDVAREEQIVLEDESGKNEMGSRVDKRMDEIAQYFNGRTLSPVQQAIVDVFGGTGNNLPISISRADGSTRRVVMRQGHENKGGTKHSTLRHFDTSSGSFTPEEILLIEDILANGTITEELRRGVAVNVYQHEINGVRYTVVTEKKDRREEFADFYTNRSGGTRSSNTQLSARAGHTTASSARKGTTSSSNTQGKGNNSTQKFSISSENEEVASLPKNEGEQALFSISTYEQQGREILEAYVMDQVSKGRLTQKQADDIISEMEDIYNICVGLKDKYAPFGNWSEAEVIVDEQGKPVFSVIKANGDYAMNLDFSLVCKKRRTLDAVLREMIDRGIINNYELGQVDMAKINDIIRQHGFETACRLCFVDAKRFRVAQVADVFCEMYNALVDKSDAQLKKISKKEGKSVPGKIARMLLEHPENRVKLSRENFMDSKGFEDMTVNKEAIMKLYNAKKGTGGPKASYGDTQYLNDILGKQWSAEAAYEVGGVRLQSFSDYVPRMVFDYVQMVADLSAKGLPVHAYTKEPTFAKQFGLTGIKINLSLVPRVEADGIAPGLDANGEYVWQEGETFPYEEAIAIQNAEGYRENCGTIAVGVSDAHIEKMLSDDNIRMVIPYHKSGLNPLVAKHNNIDQFQDYTNEQNTRDANGNKLTKAQMKSHFNFNADLHKHGNPRLAAQHYLEWCDKKGYIPRFEKFREHPNYYKLLEDFTTCVTENGVDTFVPQGAVTMTFPNEESAFGSIAELIEEGLEEDAVLEGRRQADLGSIVDDIESEFADGKKFSISAGHKQKQLDIIQESNPVGDDYHTWIRTVDDIKSFEEALDEPDYADFKGEDLDPSYTWDMVEEALQSGLITVYSSKPIENGNFVTPSRMEAESYAGNGKVYKATLPLQDIAWIDPTQGQVAKVDETKFSLSAEEQSIVDTAKANGTYMKAPNGEPTNLNEKQWAQVRTKAFKEWFGDWEKALRIEKLRNSDNASIEGDEIQKDDDPKIYKKNALEYGKTLRNEYRNQDTGEIISLTAGNKRGGIREILQHDYKNEEHLQSIAAIPQIIEKSIFIEERPNEDRENYPNVESFRYYVCGLKIGNMDYTVKSVVAVQNNGDRYYDHKLTNIEKGKLLSIIPTIQKAGIEGNLPLSAYKDKRLISILQANPSKIVDENGEPMVVYHGGTFGIKDFVPNGAMHFGSKVAAMERVLDTEWGKDNYAIKETSVGEYIWEHTDPDDADYDRSSGRTFASYEDALKDAVDSIDGVRIGQYYINAKNPMRVEDKDNAWEDAMSIAQKAGADAIVYENQFEDIGSDSYVVFSPTQIKSATGNVGTFDAENADIRYSINNNNVAGHIYGMDETRAWMWAVKNSPRGVLARGYGYIDKDRLEEFKDWYDSYLEWAADEYVQALIELKAKATKKAQEYIDEVIAGVEKHKDDFRRLAEGDNSVLSLENNARFSITPDILAANERFNAELDEFKAKTHKGLLHLGKPGAILRTIGVDADEMTLSPSVLSRHLKKHNLTADDLIGLPLSVQTPILAYRHGDKNPNLVVVTEMDVKGGKLSVSLELDENGHVVEIDNIRSVHSKDATKEMARLGAMREGELEKALRWVEKEEVQDWLGIADLNRPIHTINPELSSVANVLLSFQNPPIIGDESSQNDANATSGEQKYSLPAGIPRRRKNESLMDYANRIADILYAQRNATRDWELQEPAIALARDKYEDRVSSGWYQTKEALQDSMLGLKVFMESVLGKGTYVEDVAGVENAYLGENRLSSVNFAEASEFARLVFKPMLEEVAKLAKNDKQRQMLVDYMMAKHGLERNRVMAEKDAQAEAKENQMMTLDELRAKYRNKDYAGLTALTNKQNIRAAEAEAQAMVDAYESTHDTSALWDKVKMTNTATLTKMRESGLLSQEMYDNIANMYEFYIPLRGFDEKTSDEAYAYLSHKDSAFNAPIRRAKGRKSKADDPFAQMQAMAESAIMQGNRNVLVKQKLLNFVQNHPSDLATVSEMWIINDAVNKEWTQITATISPTDTPADVARKTREFNETMEELHKLFPGRYQKAGGKNRIPYKVIAKNLSEHQVIVKRNGVDYVITINGSPRAAQAVNGMTNPDSGTGAVSKVFEYGEKVNRVLSGVYTSYNPDFLWSNFIRDTLYTNTMSYVKESPAWAFRFNKNFLKFNPATMGRLLYKWDNGKLDMNDRTEALFYQFMKNGGETGYANIRNIEQHKSEIKEALKKANGRISAKLAWDAVKNKLEFVSRAAENGARFAAFATSMQMGRGVERAIYDAKEVSVNFNKKGSGAKFMGETGQTMVGNAAAFTSGLGRSLYVFWNAAIQGSTNFGRAAKRHPVRALTVSSVMFGLGVLMSMIGGDGEDDENAFYNLPENIRRTNIMMRFGDHWLTLPLPVEYRAMYGMGQLAGEVLSGKSRMSDWELAMAIAQQVSQMAPIDVLGAGGGWNAFTPSWAKPVIDAYVLEKNWAGQPLYKDWDTYAPEWTKAYDSADQNIVGFTRWLNEVSGGNDHRKGGIDLNPAKIEAVIDGYFGGISALTKNLVKTGEMLIGERDYQPRNIPLLRRVVYQGDERTAYRRANEQYRKYKEDHDELQREIRGYEGDMEMGTKDWTEELDHIYNSPEIEQYYIMDWYGKDISKLSKQFNETTNEEEKDAIRKEINLLKSEAVREIENLQNKKEKQE
jgi:hypothetical protein